MLPGAVLARVAVSHLRVGTFEYFAAQGDGEALKILTDYAINRHYPALQATSTPALALLEAVCESQAVLIARWMQVGFIHRVMNTDNITISGQTLDYGPCAFMDTFDPLTVFSSIDYHGRSAFGSQPRIAQWNLARFADTLLLLLADTQDKALGEEKDSLFAGTDDEWAAQPLPDGPMTIGIDGGFVRARRKAGFFEVIAGKNVLAFRRNEAEDNPSAKRFGFVQTYDTKPRRRLWELLKSQGMQENQAVLFLSDGGETVRQLQTYLPPSSAHVIDWFHIVMKLTVLQQQNKAFLEGNSEGGTHVAKTLERVKHYLWHGNVDKALECVGVLLFDLEAQRRRFPIVAKLERGVTEFDTYIRNNQKSIPNFGERYRQGDTISTAFVESTIN